MELCRVWLTGIQQLIKLEEREIKMRTIVVYCRLGECEEATGPAQLTRARLN